MAWNIAWKIEDIGRDSVVLRVNFGTCKLSSEYQFGEPR